MSDVAYPARPAVVLADLVPGEAVRDALLVVGGAALVGLAAQVSVPLPGTPVPVTGQTFGVLLVGAGLGWWRALLSLSLYLLAGGAGIPWFAHHATGFGGPTFGYIVGFVAAAALVGWLAGRGLDRRVPGTVAAMVAGNLVIYAVGVGWLAASLHVGLVRALDLGMRPFLVGDALKMALAAGLLPATWRLVGRHRG